MSQRVLFASLLASSLNRYIGQRYQGIEPTHQVSHMIVLSLCLNCQHRWRFDELFTSSEVLLNTGPASTASSFTTTQQPTVQPSNYRTAPCYHFHMRQCIKGDDCTYSHAPLSEEQMVHMNLRYDADLMLKSQSDPITRYRMMD